MCPKNQIHIMPNHCMDEYGYMQGFQCKCPSDAKIGAIPINRQMFYGTALYEVDIAASTRLRNESDIGAQDQIILELLMRVPEILQGLQALLDEIHSASQQHPADMDCIPEYKVSQTCIPEYKVSQTCIPEYKVSQTCILSTR
jgi:hypothetical protein